MENFPCRRDPGQMLLPPSIDTNPVRTGNADSRASCAPDSGYMVIVQKQKDHGNAYPAEPGKEYNAHDHSTEQVGHYDA